MQVPAWRREERIGVWLWKRAALLIAILISRFKSLIKNGPDGSFYSSVDSAVGCLALG